MVDSDSQGSVDTGVDVASEVDAEPDFDNLLGIVVDGLIGAVGGAVGTAVMTVALLVLSAVGGFDLSLFDQLAEMTGLAVLFPGNATAFGYIVFLAGGMVTWPLLFASIGSYLPGDRFALKGLPFGFVLWTGFALAFYDGLSGLLLAAYLVLTLVGHLGYGFALGSVFDYFSNRPETLV